MKVIMNFRAVYKNALYSGRGCEMPQSFSTEILSLPISDNWFRYRCTLIDFSRCFYAFRNMHFNDRFFLTLFDIGYLGAVQD